MAILMLAQAFPVPLPAGTSGVLTPAHFTLFPSLSAVFTGFISTFPIFPPFRLFDLKRSFNTAEIERYFNYFFRTASMTNFWSLL